MYKSFPSLADAFLNYFDIQLAESSVQLQRAAELRFQVYCDEFQYEPAENFADQRETDEFDVHSLQCLVIHKQTALPAGCVRLVSASEDLVLPLEKYCLGEVYLEYMDILSAERAKICEFSRLAVSPQFRRRKGENHTRVGEFDALDCSHQEQRVFSLIGIAAFISALCLAQLTGRKHIFGMMEVNLARLLRRSGLLVQQAGDFMDYHGIRAPYYLANDSARDNMRGDLHLLYDEIYERLDAKLDGAARVA